MCHWQNEDVATQCSFWGDLGLRVLYLGREAQPPPPAFRGSLEAAV